MKGIILAGGMGTRLRPLTLVANKHTLPIYDRPMVFHIIDYLRNANITDVMLVTGREHCGDLISLLGSGCDLGVDLTYKVQEEADGIAGALSLCRGFAGDEPIVVVLGDNLLENGIKPLVDKYQGFGAQISVIEVKDPQRFGVATLDETGKVVNLIEKPQNPESNLAVIGVYVYDKQVWDIISKLTPSARGEYEITDVNKAYMKQSNLYCEKVEGWWTDAGTIESMFEATLLMRKLQKGEE